MESRYLRAQKKRFDFSLDVPQKGDQPCALAQTAFAAGLMAMAIADHGCLCVHYL